MYQDQEAAGAGDGSSEGQRIAPRLRESSQRCDKLLTTLLAVKLRDQEWGKHEVKDTRGALVSLRYTYVPFYSTTGLYFYLILTISVERSW